MEEDFERPKRSLT